MPTLPFSPSAPHPRILIWMNRPAEGRPTLMQLLGALEGYGVEVTLDFGLAAARPIDAPLPYDLCVLKSHTPLTVSAAASAEAAGNVVVHPMKVVWAVRDKAAATARLVQAGVPVPRTWLAADQRQAVDGLPFLPAVIKPIIGGNSRDVYRVRTKEEALALRDKPLFGPVLIQQLVRDDGDDIKAYGVGERIDAVRKPHTASCEEPGIPTFLPAEAREMVERCRQLFGLELYGVDLLQHRGGFAVVDVNHFPGYKGVVGAGTAIADYLVGRLRQVIHWRPERAAAG